MDERLWDVQRRRQNREWSNTRLMGRKRRLFEAETEKLPTLMRWILREMGDLLVQNVKKVQKRRVVQWVTDSRAQSWIPRESRSPSGWCGPCRSCTTSSARFSPICNGKFLELGQKWRLDLNLKIFESYISDLRFQKLKIHDFFWKFLALF